MYHRITLIVVITTLFACSEPAKEEKNGNENTPSVANSHTEAQHDQDTAKDFEWQVDRFAEFKIIRYQVPGFEELPLQQKQLLFYLSQAALSGRDIIWDQNYRLNLTIRRTFEEIVKFYEGDRESDVFQKFMLYTKQMWFANGIHHHYSNNKFVATFTAEELKTLVNKSPSENFPLENGQTLDDLLASINSAIFDPTFDAKKVNKAKGVDKIAESAVNFYQNLTEKEVTDFYAAKKNGKDLTPPSYGLNSQLVKVDGKIHERIWKVGGMYTEAIEQVVYWLEKAITVSENNEQKSSLEKLVKYYQTGDLADFDDYSIAWVKDVNSDIDVINGFIEVYSDPLAYRGSFESVVSIRNPEATIKIATIAKKAQWFEDNMPMDAAFKKKEVKGITGKSIVVVMESGDASPSTPIGINLPNANWIRSQHGSKSVSLGNIVHAYAQAKGKSLEEFAWDSAEIDRSKLYSSIAGELHTDMHEVIGHASGKINDGVGTPKETLKQYSSTLEEARADLVGLYYMMDPMLVEIGVSPTVDIGKASYDSYIRGGMMQQLQRLKPGEDIEEDHMRNRQLIAAWAFEKGASDKVIERRARDDRTYFVVNDYEKLRGLFGKLLGEIQRIKSEGDYSAAEHLVETYGVKVDQELHREVLARYKKLDLAAYGGFVNPILTPTIKDGEIVDVKISYAKSFKEQMMMYAKDYSFLPNKN